MAAPTPVSALVHSSTLVTAGVYLLIRFNPLLKNSHCIIILGALGISTMLIAGLAAILERDIKKVIALSTLRQLGVMIIVVGYQKHILAYFHLLSHAYFKAILFMCAGAIIHNIKDYQDIRKMGRGHISMPTIVRILMVANMSLCGLPFLSGFYSKDLILEIVLIQRNSFLYTIMILFATLLTVRYSFRITFLLGSKKVISDKMFIKRGEDV